MACGSLKGQLNYTPHHTFNSHNVKPTLSDGSSQLPTKVILGAFQTDGHLLKIRFNIII
jgi:hypothetical protein